ncbi:MAG: DNA polymerase III subunit gamma/tau [Coriobacteriia bacterium]|nr:DNA polymerase III subunit gamma/tau [Coriobacteriia bacterium]
MAEALYRKYRPQVFADMVGQEHIERTLRNAIEQNKLSHAYLFCGPRGTGKTTTARLLAKALLCQNAPTPEPDGTCEDCELVARGEHPDVYELDAASRTGVENVREEIINRVQFAPTRGSRKIYIIDEVHMLSLAAFNALLKTLEEPPNHVLFILCTTDPQKVPETIHSRCQRFDFRSIGSDSLVARLGAVCTAEGVPFEGQALELIAHRAEGGMRNALTALEQLITFGGGNVTLAAAEEMLGSLSTSDMAEIMAALGKRDAAACFAWTARFVETGADLSRFARDMAEHARNLYVLSLAGENAPIEVSEATRKEMVAELQWFGSDRLARMLGVLGDLIAELKTSVNQRLSFEIACTRLVRPESDLTLEALAERIEALERGAAALPAAGVAAGAAVAAQPVQAAAQPAAQVAQPQPAQQQAVAQQVQPVRQPAAQAQQPVRQQYAQAAQPQPQQVQQYQQPAQVQQPVVQAQPAAQAQPQVQAQAQPAVSPASSAPAAAGSADPALLQRLSNPASLQRAWQAVINNLKRSKQAYAVLFMNTRAGLGAGGVLRIEFPAGSNFAFNTVRKPEVGAYLTDAIRQALGADMPFDIVMAGGGAAAQPVAQQQAAQQPAAQSGMPDAAARARAQIQQQTQQEQARAQAAAQAQQQEAQRRAQAQAAAQQQAAQAQVAAQPAQRNPQDVPPWEDAPAQAAQPAAAQPAAQSAAAPSPYDDQVPLDAYDAVPYDEVPYDDDDGWSPPPFDEAVPSAAGAGDAAGSDGAEGAGATAVSSPESVPSGPAEDPAEWQAALCQVFGPLQFTQQ